jgi:hypothetical protein
VFVINLHDEGRPKGGPYFVEGNDALHILYCSIGRLKKR